VTETFPKSTGVPFPAQKECDNVLYHTLSEKHKEMFWRCEAISQSVM
jgi:hypothetical protein